MKVSKCTNWSHSKWIRKEYSIYWWVHLVDYFCFTSTKTLISCQPIVSIIDVTLFNELSVEISRAKFILENLKQKRNVCICIKFWQKNFTLSRWRKIVYNFSRKKSIRIFRFFYCKKKILSFRFTVSFSSIFIYFIPNVLYWWSVVFFFRSSFSFGNE